MASVQHHTAAAAAPAAEPFTATETAAVHRVQFTDAQEWPLVRTPALYSAYSGAGVTCAEAPFVAYGAIAYLLEDAFDNVANHGMHRGVASGEMRAGRRDGDLAHCP